MNQLSPSLEDVTQILPILESKKMDGQCLKVASDDVMIVMSNCLTVMKGNSCKV